MKEYRKIPRVQNSKISMLNKFTNTKNNIHKEDGNWTLLEMTTSEGCVWIAVPVEKRKPEYFYSESEMNRWLV